MTGNYGWLAVVAGLVGSLAATPAAGQLKFGGTTSSSDLYNNLPGWQGGSWFSNTLVPSQDWRLGVQVDNLNTGVYVRQVAPNSAAARANLEVGDLIVAVAGQQVGIVDGLPIDVGTEIKRRADSSGNVTLLVQDSRTGRLASIRVKLDGNQSALRGQVVLRDRIQLPADAQATVTIENLSRPLYAVRNGETSVYMNGQMNVPFEIAYDPAYIDANDAYQVRARIISGGRVICDTIQPVRVFGNNPSSDVQVVVAPIQSSNVASTGTPVFSAGYGSNDALMAQYQQIYRRYLGRDPTSLELAALLVSPTAAADLDSLPISLMASQQYFDAVGNNNTMWITNVFEKIIGRPPTIQERDQWLKYFSDLRGSRVDVLRQLYRSAPKR
ncbi:MAG: YbaY family lipoprotein [Aureliella sp.]